MLAKKIIPLKFLAALIEIVLAGLLMATRAVYPTQSTATEATYPRPHSASSPAAFS